MALEFYLEAKPGSRVTAIGINPGRRELVLGFEDGSVDTYDHETGEIFCLYRMLFFIYSM